MDKIRVLLADVDEFDREAFARQMGKLQEFSWVIAGSVKGALEQLKSREFHALVTDYKLEDGTGLDLIQKMKETFPDGEIPVIFTAKLEIVELALQAMRLGAYDYFVKDNERRYLDLLPATIQKALQGRLKNRNLALLGNAIRSISESVFICDAKGEIQFANPAMGDLVGLPQEELPGLLATSFLRVEGIPVLPGKLCPETEKSWSGRAEVLSSPGEIIPVQAIISKILRGPGAGFQVVILNDFRQKLKSEQVMCQNEQRYKALVQSVPGTVYRSRIDRRWTKEFVSQNMEELTGFPVSDFLEGTNGQPLRSFQDLVFPEDFPKVASSVETLRAGDTFSSTYRILRRDGTIRWVLDRGMAVQDGNGALFLDGVILDITEEKQRQEMLEKNYEQFLTLANLSRAGILITDANRESIRYTNPSFLDLAGSDKEHLETSLLWNRLRYALKTASPGNSTEIEWTDERGRVRQADLLMEEWDFRGEKGFFVSISDLTKQRKREAAITHKAEHDALTGLPNRRAIVSYLRDVRKKLTRGEGSLGVFLIDLDNFKAINDRLGHEAGDRILRAVAQRLKNSLRRKDLLFRYGGDEFLALLDLPPEGIEIAKSVADRMILEMAFPFAMGEQPTVFGISVGIAIKTRKGKSLKSLISAADRAMYEAKRTGGNKVSFARETLEWESGNVYRAKEP